MNRRRSELVFVLEAQQEDRGTERAAAARDLNSKLIEGAVLMMRYFKAAR
jgi:hypothetical protein